MDENQIKISQEENSEENIILGSDGVYRWRYDLSLFKNPVILFMIWKIMIGIFIGIWIFVILISVQNVNFFSKGFLEISKVFGGLIVGILFLSSLSYFIYSIMMGGKYCVLFEMDERGLRHIQLPKQFQKARLLSEVLTFAGAASGDMTAMGSGILSGGKMSSYSQWDLVRNIVIKPKRNLIKLNSFLSKNQVYIESEDFDFVKNYILTHCEHAKIYG